MIERNKRLKNRLLILLTDKERREERRIPQSEVAREIGVTNNTIGSWLRNEVTKFEGHIVEGLCIYFGCEVGDLLYLEDLPEPQSD